MPPALAMAVWLSSVAARCHNALVASSYEALECAGVFALSRSSVMDALHSIIRTQSACPAFAAP